MPGYAEQCQILNFKLLLKYESVLWYR